MTYFEGLISTIFVNGRYKAVTDKMFKKKLLIWRLRSLLGIPNILMSINWIHSCIYIRYNCMSNSEVKDIYIWRQYYIFLKECTCCSGFRIVLITKSHQGRSCSLITVFHSYFILYYNFTTERFKLVSNMYN